MQFFSNKFDHLSLWNLLKLIRLRAHLPQECYFIDVQIGQTPAAYLVFDLQVPHFDLFVLENKNWQGVYKLFFRKDRHYWFWDSKWSFVLSTYIRQEFLWSRFSRIQFHQVRVGRQDRNTQLSTEVYVLYWRERRYNISILLVYDLLYSPQSLGGVEQGGYCSNRAVFLLYSSSVFGDHKVNLLLQTVSLIEVEYRVVILINFFFELEGTDINHTHICLHCPKDPTNLNIFLLPEILCRQPFEFLQRIWADVYFEPLTSFYEVPLIAKLLLKTMV